MNHTHLNKFNFGILMAGLHLLSIISNAQTTETLVLQPDKPKQTVIGFGASLAYYENWLNAHPRKAEIYEAIFGELSLDILRVRNAYDYDPDMVGRVKEYMVAAEASLGHPISLFSTSWGPPGYLKNTGDRKNGGTLRYTLRPGGVDFDYAGFAHWWKGSLDEYAARGILPAYISIQNEPDFSASWESCLLNPSELVNSNDTIAGYNKALEEVYDTLQTMDRQPLILGPETVGIGYNRVENYVNALDLSKLDCISHHLYHGVNENDPYSSSDFSKLGEFHPEVPHLQTEYSKGDWFSLAGLIYKSFYEEQVVAYLYWDLIWGDSGGLVTVEFPWDSNRWTDPQKGYIKTKDFYAFKQFSAFIHPGWKRINHSLRGSDGAALTFISPTGDSATCVVINKSLTNTLSIRVAVPGYRIHESAVYSTSESENCKLKGPLVDSLLTLMSRSIATVHMRLCAYDPADDTIAPVLQATNSIYQQGNIVLICSEAGMVYLVPEHTPKDLLSIREVMMDSMEVEARKAADMLVSGYENGVYWLYAADSAENISEPEELTILGVGIESESFQQFGVFPNPFTQQAILNITLIKDQKLWLSMMDSRGRTLRKESYGHLEVGLHQLILQRNNLPEGVYFFRLENASGEAKSGHLLIRD
ncbi:MAG: hypothetical protein ABFS28_04285 [Bacteroidota bacterium]